MRRGGYRETVLCCDKTKSCWGDTHSIVIIANNSSLLPRTVLRVIKMAKLHQKRAQTTTTKFG